MAEMSRGFICTRIYIFACVRTQHIGARPSSGNTSIISFQLGRCRRCAMAAIDRRPVSCVWGERRGGTGIIMSQYLHACWTAGARARVGPHRSACANSERNACAPKRGQIRLLKNRSDVGRIVRSAIDMQINASARDGKARSAHRVSPGGSPGGITHDRITGATARRHTHIHVHACAYSLTSDAN